MKRLLLSIGQALMVFAVGCLGSLLVWAIVLGIYLVQTYLHQNWSILQIISTLVGLAFVTLVTVYYRMNKS